MLVQRALSASAILGSFLVALKRSMNVRSVFTQVRGLAYPLHLILNLNA